MISFYLFHIKLPIKIVQNIYKTRVDIIIQIER